ncbi:MAG: hypothetical protein QM756_04770 [Polyangiaceae bacterium]
MKPSKPASISHGQRRRSAAPPLALHLCCAASISLAFLAGCSSGVSSDPEQSGSEGEQVDFVKEAATIGSLPPSKVFGQQSFGDTVPNHVVSNRTFQPQGVAVVRNATTTADRVYVVDSGNQRILGFRSLGACSNDATRACTNNGECLSGATCTVNQNKAADVVIGQPNMNVATCNGSNTQSMQPTASTLCLLPYPNAISLLESPAPTSIQVDSAGALYVPDRENNRVLRYTDPLSTDSVADYVWGQADFTSRACNRGLANPTSQTLCFTDAAGEGVGVEVGSDGKVWVADQGNHRVLRFPSGSKTADLVLGQANFTTGTRDATECSIPNTPSSSLVDLNPLGVATINTSVANQVTVTFSGSVPTIGVGKIIYYADANKGIGVLAWVTAQSTTTGGYVLTTRPALWTEAFSNPAGTGKKLCAPKAIRYESSTGKLYVLDWRGNAGFDFNEAEYRVVIYKKPTSGDFTNGQTPAEIITGRYVPRAWPFSDCTNMGGFCMRRPTSLELTPGKTDSFWLANSALNRMEAIEKVSGAWKATKVLSQPNLTNTALSNVSCSSGVNDDCLVGHPGGSLGIDSAGNIYANDLTAMRLMRFPTNIAAAPVTGGTAVASNGIVFQYKPGHYGEVNEVSGAGFFSASNANFVQYTSGARQMIVRDQYRVLFWNEYQASTVLSGASANGVLYQPTLFDNSANGSIGSPIGDIASDAKGRIWVAIGDRIDVYQGPLTTGMAPIRTFSLSNLAFPLNQGNTGVVNINGLAYSDARDVLFVADGAGHRILSIPKLATVMTGGAPTIDMVLGQRSAAHRGPNRDRNAVTEWDNCYNVEPDSFANLSGLKLDRKGNLYVTDATHEGWQCSNNRIVEYDAASLIADTTHPFFCGVNDAKYIAAPGSTEGSDPALATCGTPRRAKRVYGPQTFTAFEPAGQIPGYPTVPMSVAFDASNHMILTVDAYHNAVSERVYYYKDPVPSCTYASGCFVPPTAIVPGLNSQPFSAAFDNLGNLGIIDNTWNRLLYYSSADVAPWMAVADAIVQPPLAPISCSSEYSSGWCQTVTDGIHGQCNSGEWATAGQSTGYVEFNWSTPRTVSAVTLYDRACPERVTSGHIDVGNAIYNFGALEDTGNTGTRIAITPQSVSAMRIYIDSSDGGANPGIGEVVFE